MKHGSQGTQRQCGSVRRGVGLINMAIVISFGSILLGISAYHLQTLMSIDTDTAESTRMMSALPIWSARFRADVYASKLLAVRDDEVGNVLLLDSGEAGLIRYEISSHSIKREVASDGKRRFELLRLPRKMSATFVLEEQETKVVQLQFKRNLADPAESSKIVIVWEAAANRQASMSLPFSPTSRVANDGVQP